MKKDQYNTYFFFQMLMLLQEDDIAFKIFI